MSRRIVSITLDNLDDLPSKCRKCVFWQLDPIALQRAVEAGDTAFEKESWVSATLLEWGSCGKIAYVDSVPAGYVMYSPPAYVPRSLAFPTSPVSADAVLLMTGQVLPEFEGGGLGRMMLQSLAKDLARRNVRAIEAFGDEKGEAGTCMLPAGHLRARRVQDGPPAPPLPAAAPGAEVGRVVARGRRGRARAATRVDDPGPPASPGLSRPDNEQGRTGGSAG